MKLYLGLDSQKILLDQRTFANNLEFKRRDIGQILEVVCFNGTLSTGAIAPPSGTTFRFGVKRAGSYSGDFLFYGVLAPGYSIDTQYNVTTLGAPIYLNTTSLDAAFANEPAKLDALFEIEWTGGGKITSSFTVSVSIHNDVIRGNEGTPASLPLFYTAGTSDFQASREQAEAGADNGVWMTPLRTAQAITALAATTDWADIANKPSTFTPSSHLHALADLTQGGASSGQVPAWNGSAWAPATPVSTLHTHGNITNSGAIGATSGRPVITGPSGVLQAGSFGTAAGTFCQGNDSRFLDVSGGITAIAVVETMPDPPDATTLYIVTT